MSDLISRADAIERIANDNVVGGMKRINEYRNSTEHNDYLDGISTAIATIEDLPSADAEPIVIRSKTLMPTKDFKEWAKRVRETNPNAVVIPCDAEVISAEAVQGEWEHWGSPFSDESEVIDTIVCSVCGARFIEPKDEPKGEYNFCPSCGARMKGGEEE